VFLFNIGFHLAAPVVNIYYVEYMHLSKGSIGLLSAAFLVFQVLSSRFWGRMGDRLGNHVVAFISMAILIVQAALYSLVPSLPFILIMQIVGGFAFGGYAMSTFNSIIALGTPSNRPVVISLFNVVGGLGGFLSPSAGTAVLDHYGLLAAFLLAAVLRTLGTLSMGVPARTEWKQGGISKLLYLRHFGVLAFTGRRKAHTAKHGGGVYRTTKSSSTVAASPSE
jgi:DHA1 family multidrug resistance protein-like MFS transporter